jgi:hypothetical protein
VLWVGGTSALARTFLEELDPARRRRLGTVVLAAPEPPPWPLPADGSVLFLHLDMLDGASVASAMHRCPVAVRALVWGVRASLVWGAELHARLNCNLERLLRSAVAGAGAGGRGQQGGGVRFVLHVSSVAVMNHLQVSGRCASL